MNIADELNTIFTRMPEAFVPEKAEGVNAIIQFNLSGEGASEWYVKVANNQLSVSRGQMPTADLTLNMAAADYVAISLGEVDPMKLFMSGKVKLQGNMTLAIKLQEMFDRSQVSPD